MSRKTRHLSFPVGYDDATAPVPPATGLSHDRIFLLPPVSHSFILTAGKRILLSEQTLKTGKIGKGHEKPAHAVDTAHPFCFHLYLHGGRFAL